MPQSNLLCLFMLSKEQGDSMDAYAHLDSKLTQLDDVLEEDLLEMVQVRVGNPLLPWVYVPASHLKDNRLYDWYQMTHMAWDCDEPLSDISDVCEMVLRTALRKSGRTLKRILRMRVINSQPGDTGREQPHIDLVGPHQTAIFFPFDTDGNTQLYKERSWLEQWERPENLTESYSLEPKANRWYEFDGTHWRTTGRPEKFDGRLCVVFNFLATDIPPETPASPE
jgi:hypothetical protein